jgi:hypothetical protein
VRKLAARHGRSIPAGMPIKTARRFEIDAIPPPYAPSSGFTKSST